jgi:regulator of protease activity HflC (stomatin/prohibitin superfamily)
MRAAAAAVNETETFRPFHGMIAGHQTGVAMSPFAIFVLAVLALIVALVLLGVKSVPQSEEWTVERFGRFTNTLKPGLSLIVPLVDRIGARLSLRETVLEVPGQEVITRDNASVTADAVVFYQIVDAARAAYQVNDLERAIVNLSMTNIRSVIGSMDLDDVLSNRDGINDRLLRIVDDATAPWGIKVTRIEIKELQPPADLVQSMARQMKAVREKRAVVTEAEGKREAQILEAQGGLEAAKLQAEARERLAAAEAKATEDVSKAIREGDLQAINYFVATRYIEAMAKFADSRNQKTLILPIEAAATLGSLAGIAEIARETFGSQGRSGSGEQGPGATGGGRRVPPPPPPATGSVPWTDSTI